jgi:hypothetical protein
VQEPPPEDVEKIQILFKDFDEPEATELQLGRQ